MASNVGLVTIAVIFTIISCFSIYSVNSQCTLTVKTDTPEKDPIYLTSDGELWAPDGPTLEWASGESSLVACTGSKNTITTTGAKGVLDEVSCKSGTDFTLSGKKVAISDIACKSAITGDVQATGVSCVNGGTLKQIGFNVNDNNIGFIPLIDVCYNDITGSAIYTRHVIKGKAIGGSVSEPDRPGFKTTGIPKQIKPANSYKQSTQLKRLSALLGESEAIKYIAGSSFLARGHLAPDNDGIFRSWKHATYFYINVAPEWQVVNAGNWLRVENVAREKAEALKDNLVVYTGVSGVLELPDSKGKPVKIFLEENGNLPVPKWYWKILKYGNSGIAFVTLNNPFAAQPEEICKNVCEKYGWTNKAFSDLTKGYTYCCEVSALTKVIADVPKEAAVKLTLSK